MKKLLLIALVFASSYTYANDLSRADKKKIYDFIELQLDRGQITPKEAQKMWLKLTK